MKTTQRQQVLNHLEKNGSITSWEAITNYRATRLSGIIYALRKVGYEIISTPESNGSSHYARYILQGREHEND